MRVWASCLGALGALALAGCGASVSELVVSVDGPAQQPIRGATVTVVGTGVAGRTGASGDVSLSPLSTGVYSDVKVSARGYTTVLESDIGVPFGGPLLVVLQLAGRQKPRAFQRGPLVERHPARGEHAARVHE